MWKRTLALLTATAIAGAAIQPVAAQSYDNNRSYGGYDRSYDNPYDRNRNGVDDRYENRSYNNDRYYGGQGGYDNRSYAQGGYGDQRGYEYDRNAAYRCDQARQGNTAGGAIIGALAGGLLGNSISRGPQRGAGTAVGAIAGGLLGATVGSKLSCDDQRYAQRTYYSGLEAGRAHQRYDWRGRDAYGYLDVGDYYMDRGRRCANYTQQIYVNGRPEVASGRACRMGDGTWQAVG
jgi:surface antigen